MVHPLHLFHPVYKYIGLRQQRMLYLRECKITLLHSFHFFRKLHVQAILNFVLSFTVDELGEKLSYVPVNIVIN